MKVLIYLFFVLGVLGQLGNENISLNLKAINVIFIHI